MNSIFVSGIVFGSASAGAVVGMLMQRILPDRYLQPETKEIVRLGTGLIATMAALVLGLLVSTPKSSFDEETSGFRQPGLDMVLLDRTLAQFGEEAKPVRAQLQRTVEQTIASLWPENEAESSRIDDVKITTEGGAGAGRCAQAFAAR